MPKGKSGNGFEEDAQDVGERSALDAPDMTPFARDVERLRGEPDAQFAYVSALVMRTLGQLLSLMSPDAERVTFYVDSTGVLFTRWLATKVSQPREVETDEGFYAVMLTYPTLDYLLNPRPTVRLLVQEVLLEAYHTPTVETKPLGGIAFKSDDVRPGRIEVTAVSSLPELSPLFHEVLQLIGAAYPESGLAALHTNKGGRPKSIGPSWEKLQLIKRIGNLRAQGLSHAQIGDRVKLTRSRVSQICRENGFEKGVEGN